MDEPVSTNRERTTVVVERATADGPKELFLTIENTIEDRVNAYTRLLRMRQILRKSRGGP